MGHAVTNAASTVGTHADNLTASAGSGLQNLAHTIRENAPHDGMLSEAAETVAGTLRQGGQYLEQEGLGGLMTDCAHLVRNNPLPALFLGIGLGYVIGRVLRS